MKEVKSGIYVIERIKTGQKYVGQAGDIEYRMNCPHVSSTIIYRALKKYDKSEFIRYPIRYCEIKDLDFWEEWYIIILHSHVSEGGYNISWGGPAPLRGVKKTEEWKQLMREMNLGEKNPRYGIPNSEEQKRKISLATSGEKNHNYGKHPSEESKEKNRQWHLGKKRSPETIELLKKHSGSENKNYGKKMKGKSRYFGVAKQTRKGVTFWRFRLGKNDVRCKTEIEAAKLYDKYVIENKLPRPLNFPDGIHSYWEINK